jgi:fatty-acyl-CoA synthase
MIIGSEPVSMDAIETFTATFAPYGLPPTAIKPSYGIAEATLFVSTIAPTARPTVVHLDRDHLTNDRAVRVAADAAGAVAQVSCGQIARSQWAVIVDSETGTELADGRVGEIWLHGNNIAPRYWGRPEESRLTFGATLVSRRAEGSHADGSPVAATWLRTGDLGTYLDGELYVTGRIADLVTVDGRHHYPQDIEATTANASTTVRRGYVAAFSVPADAVAGSAAAGTGLVIIAEHAPGRSAAGDRGHPRGRLRPTRGRGRRRPLRASRRPPPHHERQAGALRVPRRVPARRVRRAVERQCRPPPSPPGRCH